MEDSKFTPEGVLCSLCGTFNTHDECGTYQVLVPTCKSCGLSTELSCFKELINEKS